MLLSQQDDHAMLRAKALADAIKDVAGELRLIDVADFIAYIRAEQFANIQDVVNSSVELFFKHGTLTYGSAAEFDLTWDSLPTVVLDMEFRHMTVTVLFSLTLRAFNAAIDVRYISFGEPASDEENTRRLSQALAAARLPAAEL